MKLYYYGIDYNIGGLEVFGRNLISFVRKKQPNIDVVVLAAFSKIAFEEELVLLGCTIIHLPDRKRHPLKYYNSLKKALSEHEPNDLFQINACSYRNFLLFKATRKSGIRTIIVGHLSSSVSHIGNIAHVLMRMRFSALGTKIAVSEETGRYMFGRHCSAVKIITNGIDFSKFAFSSNKRNAKRAELGLDNSTLAIAHIGRLSKQKNQLFTLDVIKEVLATGKNVKCFFIGNRVDTKISNIIANECSDSISLISPEHEGIDAIYDAMDIVLVPSVAEGGLSFVAIEALRSGCRLLYNERLGIIQGSPKNVLYLPLNKEIWANEIAVTSPDSLSNRSSIDLDAVYSIERSLSQYLALYDIPKVS